ncbi:MAG: hypothetical protein K0R34_935 [Herbinix sp.]|jgi:hypothetical protein|nr:hypothetical protein [Herbinix sp.]
MLSISVLNTYQALVDAIIPRTPILAQEFGRIQYYGALDLKVDQFLIYELEHYPVPLALPVARVLDAAAIQWRRNQGYYGPVSFAMLSPIERLSVLGMLRQEELTLEDISIESQVDPGLLWTAISMLDTYTLMGYYSEWSGYGTTRLYPPEERVLEFKPLSWLQIGYPGPSLGYRVLRGITLD